MLFVTKPLDMVFEPTCANPRWAHALLSVCGSVITHQTRMNRLVVYSYLTWYAEDG